MYYQPTKIEISECSDENPVIKQKKIFKPQRGTPINCIENVEEVINNLSVILPNLIVDPEAEYLTLSRTPSFQRKAHSSPVRETHRRHSGDANTGDSSLNRSSRSASHVGGSRVHTV